MAFQSITKYNETYGNRFRLADDGDYADVIFLYHSIDDVLIGDVHYLKYPEYSGYVHCLGTNCPACRANSRKQKRIFIPIYLVEQQKVVFWDRTPNIQNQLQRDVFSRYPDPSKVVFRITRKGAYRDINTEYTIEAIASNNIISYEEVCTQFNIKFPDYYETICADKSSSDLNLLCTGGTVSDTPVDFKLPEYQIQPRSINNVADTSVDTVQSDLDTTELSSTPVTSPTKVVSPDEDNPVPF